MNIRLPEHSHCKYCGDPIRFGEEYCNDQCRSALIAREAGEVRKERLFYVGAALSVVAIFVIAWLL